MTPTQEDTSHQAPTDLSRGKQPEPIAVTQRGNITPDHQLPSSSFESSVILPASQQLRPIRKSNDGMLASTHYLTNPLLLEDSIRSPRATPSARYLERTRPRQATLPPFSWTSGGSVTPNRTRPSPFPDEDIPGTEETDTPEPATKRYKLCDDGWIEEALKRGQEQRRAPDPYPMPQLSPPGHPWEPRALLQANAAATEPRLQLSSQWLSPSGPTRSSTIRSAELSRRPSSAHSATSPSYSPALSHRSTTSANRLGPPSPTDGSVMGGFSDLDISSRANSRAPDGVDCDATFSHVHDMPRVELLPRLTANLSKLEQLPKQIFMRIIMYCGYKSQVLLRACSYNLYFTVDLEAIPWEEKTSTILSEERYNPNNFPKKPSKTQGGEGDGPNDDEEVSRVQGATKGKQAVTKANSSSPRRTSSKNKGHISTYGKWGCYCCYKILPAHYFEGALLEDKEGRALKSNKLRGADAAESDKKIDMRVEYVQILGTVPGSRFPDWLAKKSTSVHTTDVKSYIVDKMKDGVDCDDLRAYYKHITRDTHLVAPIRDITPVFTPSSVTRQHENFESGDEAPEFAANMLPRTPLPEELSISEGDSETSRPLYKCQTGNETQFDANSASYTYQISIPENAERGTGSLPLPKTEPVSRICLPPRSASTKEIVLEVGDVVPLRRICIPCGTKFAVYRRNCNRKIISKTDEQWWVCDCPEVRLAGRSTGCPTCRRKVIY